jgi:hypothetical protein
MRYQLRYNRMDARLSTPGLIPHIRPEAGSLAPARS